MKPLTLGRPAIPVVEHQDHIMYLDFVEACKADNVSKAEKSLDQLDRSKTTLLIRDLFVYSCRFSNHDIMEYLYNRCPSEVDYNTTAEGFIAACESGNPVATMFILIRGVKLDTYTAGLHTAVMALGTNPSTASPVQKNLVETLLIMNTTMNPLRPSTNVMRCTVVSFFRELAMIARRFQEFEVEESIREEIAKIIEVRTIAMNERIERVLGKRRFSQTRQ